MTGITEAEKAVKAAEAELAAAEDEAAKARQKADYARAVLDSKIIERDGEPNPHQDQIDRMAYIESQKEQRAARANAALQLRSIFPDGELPQGRSQLDEAMKGSRKRGTARPAAKKAD